MLHKQRAVVQYLAETFVYQLHRKVDEIRDQWQRTALHYAYAHDDNDQIVNVLLDVGASEFTLDMVSTNSSLCLFVFLCCLFFVGILLASLLCDAPENISFDILLLQQA